MAKTLLASLLCLAMQILHGQDLSNFRDLEQTALHGNGDTVQVRALIKLYNVRFATRTDSLSLGMNYIFKAYQIALKISDYPGVAESALRIADNLRYFKNEEKATEYYFYSLKYYDLAKFKGSKARAYVGIGLIFYNQKKWDEALEYFQRATTINKRYLQSAKQSTPVYLSGLCYNEKKQYLKAVEFLNLGLKYGIAEKDSNRMHECYLGIAKAKSELGEFGEALKLYTVLREYYSSQRRPTPMALVMIHKEVANILLKQGKPEEALVEAKKAYDEDLKLTISYFRIEITELLSRIYKQLQDHEKAYLLLLESQAARDSAANRDILAEISVAEAKYEFEKKEDIYNQQIAADKRKRNFALIISAVLVLLLISGIYFYFILRRERRKSEALLLNIMPTETAEELKKYGHVIPRKHENVTIMFCDVKEFTKISEKMSPETLVNMLDMYISGFDEIVSQGKLEKIKTIGDAYMCAGGLHHPEGNPAVEVVSAAKEILRYVHEIEDEVLQKYGYSFSFRIGIHTGPLVSGVVGSRKYAYDIWGDTVNTAARMEEQSEPGRINISASTKALVQNEFQTEYRGKIRAKNKDEMEMYFVV